MSSGTDAAIAAASTSGSCAAAARKRSAKRAGIVLRAALSAEIVGGEQYALDAEPGIDGFGLREAAIEDAGDEQDDQRDRDFGGHQPVAEAGCGRRAVASPRTAASGSRRAR